MPLNVSDDAIRDILVRIVLPGMMVAALLGVALKMGLLGTFLKFF